MVDDDDDQSLKHSWARFNDLPDDLVAELPGHLRIAFAGARHHRFAIEVLSPGITVPGRLRSPRRLVLVADDGDEGEEATGPLAFDLSAIAQDVRSASRIFIVAATADGAVFDAAYAAAVADLAEGFAVALIVETEASCETAWVRTLTSLRSAGVASSGTAA